MRKLILCFLLASSFKTMQAQDKVLPAEAALFLPAGHELLDYIAGDLNGDKKPDAILIAKITGEDTATEEEKRPMIILIRQANGKLKQVKRNDDVILCRQCGGVYGDPYDGTAIKNNGFTLTFYGGSSWRWGYDYTFGYKAGDWYLLSEKQISFQSGDPETTMKETTIEQTELGDVPFEKFNASPPYEDAKWKVIAAKTYFYDVPKLGSKPRKGYLVKGNEAMQLRVLKNFVQVSYDNGKGQFTSGYVLKKNLVKL